MKGSQENKISAHAFSFSIYLETLGKIASIIFRSGSNCTSGLHYLWVIDPFRKQLGLLSPFQTILAMLMVDIILKFNATATTKWSKHKIEAPHGTTLGKCMR